MDMTYLITVSSFVKTAESFFKLLNNRSYSGHIFLCLKNKFTIFFEMVLHIRKMFKSIVCKVSHQLIISLKLVLQDDTVLNKSPMYLFLPCSCRFISLSLPVKSTRKARSDNHSSSSNCAYSSSLPFKKKIISLSKFRNICKNLYLLSHLISMYKMTSGVPSKGKIEKHSLK